CADAFLSGTGDLGDGHVWPDAEAITIGPVATADAGTVTNLDAVHELAVVNVGNNQCSIFGISGIGQVDDAVGDVGIAKEGDIREVAWVIEVVAEADITEMERNRGWIRK